MRAAAIAITFAVIAAALACGASAAPDDAAKRRGSAAPDDAAKRPGKAKRSDSMHGFDKAQASFRDHAARELKLSPDRVLVSPIEEDPSVQLDERVGAAWAFYGSSKDQPARQVRGWAVADGTVITHDKHLDRLLAEAGVWSGKPTLDAEGLAKRLVWAMGMNHRLVGPRSLNVDAKGAGTLSFQDAYRPPGPGGAGERISQHTVTLTADHQARLVTAPVAAPAPPSID